jgi:hypothetical protein
MSDSPKHDSSSGTPTVLTSWNTGEAVWGKGFILSTVLFSLALRGISFAFTFVPFGGLGAFFLGVPLCALAFKILFSALTMGSQPTVRQAVLASAIALGPPAFSLARDLSLVLDDGGNYWLFALVCAALVPLNVAWALLAMHLWKNSSTAARPGR